MAKKWILYCGLAAVMFAAGFLLRPVLLPEPAAAAGTDGAAQVRVYDGELQWFDGSAWHTSGAAGAALAADPFKMAARPSGLLTDGISAGVQRAEGTVPSVAPRRSGSSGGGAVSGGGSAGSSAGGGSAGGSSGGGATSGDGEDTPWSSDMM